MSIASKILDLNNLKDRIQRKLSSLGLLSRSADGLTECTEAIEDIDETSPYMMSSSGIVNVAAYKYAQVDQTVWQPAGATPSGLVSVVTELGANGIESTPPTSTTSIGTIYPPRPYSGIYANEIKIDNDVIKASNIKYGQQILGITGTNIAEIRHWSETLNISTATNVFSTNIGCMQDRLLFFDLKINGSAPSGSKVVTYISIYPIFRQGDINYFNVDIIYTAIDGDGNYRCYVDTETQNILSFNNNILTITLPNGVSSLQGTYFIHFFVQDEADSVYIH